MSSWVDNAKAALQGEKRDDVDVVKARRPPILDRDAIQAITAPLLAVCAWLGAFFREAIAGQPLDVLALLLRLLALALTVRAFLLCWTFAKRLSAWLNTDKFALALTPHGLLLRTPQGDRSLPRETIVDIRECTISSQSAAHRWSEVFVVTDPATGGLFVSIGPFFDASSSVLAARLTRWRGPVTAPNIRDYPEPDRHANTLFREVDSGNSPEGVAAVPLGRAWLRRGPYASILLGFAVLDGFIRIKPHAGTVISPTVPLAIAVCLLVVPLIWAITVHRQLGPVRRAAMVMSPSALLVSIRSGIDQIRWSQLARVEIVSKNVWSVFEGMYESRSIVCYAVDGFTMAINEAYFDVPADVIVALIEAYQNQVLPVSRGSDTSKETRAS